MISSVRSREHHFDIFIMSESQKDPPSRAATADKHPTGSTNKLRTADHQDTHLQSTKAQETTGDEGLLRSDEIATTGTAAMQQVDTSLGESVCANLNVCVASIGLGEVVVEKYEIEANGAHVVPNILTKSEPHAAPAPARESANAVIQEARPQVMIDGARAAENNLGAEIVMREEQHDEANRAAALATAAQDNDLRLLLTLVKGGADPNTRFEGWTPLLTAVTFGNPTAISILARFGADANCLDPDGDTPLIIACSLGRLDCVQQLLAGGANPRILTQVRI